MSMDDSTDWVPLLVPDMPSPETLMPWLERMHSARHYSNFGPLVRELESEFARRFDMPLDSLTTVSNATLGLELVLQALELAPKSRVLLPAFTFVATATAVIRAGHVPVLADVDPESWMLTPDIARAACADTRVDAVLPVATFGMPHDMQAWQRFEESTGLPVVIDAAAAYGSQWLQKAQGTLVFSLHTTKSLPAGEGGLVVSTRPAWRRVFAKCLTSVLTWILQSICQ